MHLLQIISSSLCLLLLLRLAESHHHHHHGLGKDPVQFLLGCCNYKDEWPFIDMCILIVRVARACKAGSKVGIALSVNIPEQPITEMMVVNPG